MASNSSCLIITFIHEPIICLFGLVTNLFNILIFFKLKDQDKSFKYMLIISINDFLHLALNVYAFTFYCNNFYLNQTYSAQIFRLFIKDYLVKCSAVFTILIDIFLSLERYMVLLNKKYLTRNSHHNILLIILLFISLLYYFPVLFLVDIKPIETMNSTNQNFEGYTLKNNHFGSLYGEMIQIFLTSFRTFLFMIVISAFNLMNAYELRQRFKVKKNSNTNKELSSEVNSNKSVITSAQAKNKTKASRNISLMVIWTCVIHLCLNTPFQIVFILINVISYLQSTTHLLRILSFSLHLLAYGLNMFIYFSFNKRYRQFLIIFLRKLLFLN